MKKHDFSKYEIRTGSDGKRGIYLKAYNVRMATFNANTAQLQEALEDIFRASSALSATPRGTEA